MTYYCCCGLCIRWIIPSFKADDDVAGALSYVERTRHGALHWQTVLDHFKGFVKTVGWSFEDWNRCSEHGSEKGRFEYCIDITGNPQYQRALQGHSGGAKLDTKVAKVTSQFHTDGPTFLSHIGSCVYRSIVKGCLIEGGIRSRKRKRQA